MSDQRFNTGNPIGSDSPFDRSDNTRDFDERMLSDEPVGTDRLGRPVLNWAGIAAAGGGDTSIAVDAAARAVAAAGQVEQNAEQIAQDAAEQAVQDVVAGVDGQVERAEGYADRAETAAESVKPYVDSALSDLSTAANKFYPTLAEANADIANIEVNQPVHVGEAVNGGLWYKATSEATTLTKSAYDPALVAKTYATELLSTKLTTTTNLNDLLTGTYYITSPDMNTIYDDGTYIALGYPPDMARGGGAVVEVTRSAGNGTLSFQKLTYTRQGAIFTRDGVVGASFNAWIKTDGGGGSGGYETVALGLASVEDGDTFWVYPNNSNSLGQLTLYMRIDETTSEVVFTQKNPLDEFLITQGTKWEMAQ